MSKPSAPDRHSTEMIRNRCLCLHAQRAARALARRFDDAFRPLGLTSGQFSLLMSLNRPIPPTLGAVAALLGLDRTTLTANLKPLERRGLLSVKTDSSDRRNRLAALTPAGATLLACAVPVWTRVQQEVEAHVAGADADRLRADLNSLC